MELQGNEYEHQVVTLSIYKSVMHAWPPKLILRTSYSNVGLSLHIRFTPSMDSLKISIIALSVT